MTFHINCVFVPLVARDVCDNSNNSWSLPYPNLIKNVKLLEVQLSLTWYETQCPLCKCGALKDWAKRRSTQCKKYYKIGVSVF